MLGVGRCQAFLPLDFTKVKVVVIRVLLMKCKSMSFWSSELSVSAVCSCCSVH